jgi:flagellar FliL protein
MNAPQAKWVADVKKKLIIIIAAVLVIGGGAGGAWWWMRVPVEAKEPPLESRGLVSFEPFLVNLADEGANRYLKVTLGVVLGTAEDAKHIESTPVVLSRLRSDILELLTEQSSSQLVSAEGKQALKAAIKTRLSEALEHKEVVDVLFSEFVVQF